MAGAEIMATNSLTNKMVSQNISPKIFEELGVFVIFCLSVGSHSHFRWGTVASEQKLDEVVFGLSHLSYLSI